MVGSNLYRFLIKTFDPLVPQKLLPLWNHPAGPKTVFFWAPTVKWGLVIAGIADITRPADKLSFSQSLTLAATGTIWSRYCLVIIPMSWYLFSVNFFVANVGLFQLARIWNYKRSLKNENLLEQQAKRP